jgi:hypothetical protein
VGKHISKVLIPCTTTTINKSRSSSIHLPITITQPTHHQQLSHQCKLIWSLSPDRAWCFEHKRLESQPQHNQCWCHLLITTAPSITAQKLAIVTRAFHGLPQSLQTKARIAHGHFLSNSLFKHSFYHCKLHNLCRWKVLLYNSRTKLDRPKSSPAQSLLWQWWDESSSTNYAVSLKSKRFSC